MMMMISNLPNEMVEEILSRVSFKDLRPVQLTCKKWYALTADRSFANKQIEKVAALSSSSPGENQFVMITEFNIFLIGVNLLRTQNNDFDLSIKRNGTLVRLNTSIEAFRKSSQVIHCSGVFLCVWGNILVLWNPYWRKTKWISPYSYGSLDMYALGYDKFSGSHKILRFYGKDRDQLDVYDLRSNSWSIPDGSLGYNMKSTKTSVSLKGNTYWCAIDEESGDYYLFCFDFTSERFGPPLSLPLTYGGQVYLSAVKEEKLAVLIKMWGAMEIWVTNKIEPDEVSWSIFLKVDMEDITIGSFLIDEEKRVAVVFDDHWTYKPICNNVYIIGENGYFKRVDLRKSPYTPLCPFKCSYLPNSAQIK